MRKKQRRQTATGGRPLLLPNTKPTKKLTRERSQQKNRNDHPQNVVQRNPLHHNGDRDVRDPLVVSKRRRGVDSFRGVQRRRVSPRTPSDNLVLQLRVVKLTGEGVVRDEDEDVLGLEPAQVVPGTDGEDSKTSARGDPLHPGEFGVTLNVLQVEIERLRVEREGSHVESRVHIGADRCWCWFWFDFRGDGGRVRKGKKEKTHFLKLFSPFPPL